MIIDFHAATGPIPHTGRDRTFGALAKELDRCGIAMAVVESLRARLYRDYAPHDELLTDCRSAASRFLPAATLSLESDLYALDAARTARRRGFACVVLHGPLFEESRVLHELLAALAREPLPVYRALRFEELDIACRVARAHPAIEFVMAPVGFEGWELNHRLIEQPNVCLSAARTLLSTGQVETACRRMGAERILYASDWPFQHPARVIGLILDAEIGEAEKAMILGGSARKLLGRHGISVPGSDVPPKRIPSPCPIIDAHGHVGGDFRRPDFDASADAVVRCLDRCGIERIYASGTEGVLGDAREGNRRMEEVLRRYPDRFRGYLVINPWMGEDCLADIRRCRERGFMGLKPYPNAFNHLLSDPVMEPALELAEHLELPVLCHTTAADLRRMLDKQPRLRILAAHMTFESDDKARLAREFPNTVLEMSGAGAGPEDISRAIEIAGEDKLVFGSDLNSCVPGFTLQPILCSGLAESTLKKLLRENALRFFSGA